MKRDDFGLIRQRLGGISRRGFLKYCSLMAVSMGLSPAMGSKIAEAITNPKRPPVIWLSYQACTGCTETLLRATHPTLEHLILDLISLDYHETLSTPAGKMAEEMRDKTVRENKGKFIAVVDGSIPVKNGGVYLKIGGKTAVEITKEILPHAQAAIAIGSCASWGGVPSSGPNPTGATPLGEFLKANSINTPVINIPGCPPNPYNFLSTVLYVLTLKRLPELDKESRPKFAYSRLIHENCERRPHFDAGRFANSFGDEGHRMGYCLYKLGCKGPETFNNCSTLLFGDTGAGTWPVGTGHPCFGCSEKGVGFTIPLHSPARLRFFTPPDTYPQIAEPRGKGVTIGAAALAAGIAGAAIGAAAATAKKLGKKDNPEEEQKS